MRRYRKGTRVGGVQRWTYSRGRWSEKKVAPRKWKFTYQAGKSQNRPGHFPQGGRIRWHINAYQDVVRVKGKKNTYLTTMHGTKTQKRLRFG